METQRKKQTKRQKNVFTSSSWGLVTPVHCNAVTKPHKDSKLPFLTDHLSTILQTLGCVLTKLIIKCYLAWCAQYESNVWIWAKCNKDSNLYALKTCHSHAFFQFAQNKFIRPLQIPVSYVHTLSLPFISSVLCLKT